MSGPASARSSDRPAISPRLPDTAKWLLTVGMLIGRLEILTVLVLFVPAFWHR
jgi:Trk-type K+ transport system membrane component